MGQKVNPYGLRVGIVKPWQTQWYAGKKEFSVNLIEDNKIREFIKQKYYQSAISSILITRKAGLVTIDINTARPGVMIGKEGAGVEQIKKEIAKISAAKSVVVNIRDIKRPDIDAQLVAENIAAQLEKRASFRRTMKMAMQRAMKGGAKGIKTMVSGRLGGAEIARTESYHEGSIPLQTLRADIDYGFAEANTTFGKIGVKVWIFKGEIFGKPVLNKIEGGKD
ncbi:MAG: 30S ribosomal protein S3 [Christensenellales bacterium]|jgi:small subunit ribosomal protein S3